MIYKITITVEYNCWLDRSDTQLNNQTNQNQLKSRKLLRQRVNKRYHDTFGTKIINRPMSPPSQGLHLNKATIDVDTPLNLPTYGNNVHDFPQASGAIFDFKLVVHLSGLV